jgi:hypothetical protein
VDHARRTRRQPGDRHRASGAADLRALEASGQDGRANRPQAQQEVGAGLCRQATHRGPDAQPTISTQIRHPADLDGDAGEQLLNLVRASKFEPGSPGSNTIRPTSRRSRTARLWGHATRSSRRLSVLIPSPPVDDRTESGDKHSTLHHVVGCCTSPLAVMAHGVVELRWTHR